MGKKQRQEPSSWALDVTNEGLSVSIVLVRTSASRVGNGLIFNIL